MMTMMMKGVFAKEEPLVSLQLDPVATIKICLDEPVFVTPKASSNKSTSPPQREMHGKIMSTCYNLELVYAKIKQQRRKQLSIDSEQQTLQRLNERLASLVSQVMNNTQTIEEYLQESGVFRICPSLAPHFGTHAPRSELRTKREYFSQMAVLNQIYSLSAQLRSDILLSNHKYMSHQIALLYQCISGLEDSSVGYKQSIKQNFEQIRSTIELNGNRLSIDQQEWLRQLTADLTRLLTAFPPELQELVYPLCFYITQGDANISPPSKSLKAVHNQKAVSPLNSVG
eukprot:TRINITY_DN6222_c0_g3_i1.p1 TRINITY_DN6222_c0_g3~~TRINITY_DN6222_c0_g3_i1.p1  ORF type:complete len:285 (+),score=65.15 TRINITY_DN6222_c0_g3_i1:508-1362(+)